MLASSIIGFTENSAPIIVLLLLFYQASTIFLSPKNLLTTVRYGNLRGTNQLRRGAHIS
jgi:hypothetical protein